MMYLRVFSRIFTFVFYILHHTSAIKKYDEEHFKMYPYCGKLFGHGSNNARNRVVNSGDSQIFYPWVVWLVRKYRNKQNQFSSKQLRTCSGTVIGYKHVVTAGHCVCPTLSRNPDVHKDAVCKLQGRKLVNQIDPANNRISVFGGSRDITVLRIRLEHRVEMAYLMMDPKNDDFMGTTDIGILITSIHLFDKEKLKNTLLPNSKPPILPICLASQELDFDNEKLQGVGWGLRYDQSPKGKDPSNPYYSSCMTNEVGDKKWRFQACDMKQIIKNNWSCEKNELPPEFYPRTSSNPGGFSEEFLRCRKYWIGARWLFYKTDKSKIKFMDSVQKIFVHELDTRRKLVCYSEREFTKTGWCKVHGKDSINGAWGFCSPSCNQDLMRDGQERSSPKIYQKMEWTVQTKPSSGCSNHRYWDPTYMVCMDKTLPQADVGIFKVSDSSNIKNIGVQDLYNHMEFSSFEKEYQSEGVPDFESSYLAPCKGDSGSGHWLTINKDDAEPWKGINIKQMVLVAVYTTGYKGSYKLNGFNEQGVCGGNIQLESGERLVGENICTKTTNGEVLEFLKLNTDICNLDDPSNSEI